MTRHEAKPYSLQQTFFGQKALTNHRGLIIQLHDLKLMYTSRPEEIITIPFQSNLLRPHVSVRT